MPKYKNRSSRPSHDFRHDPSMTIPILAFLIMGILIFGMISYSFLLALVAALIVSLIGWFWLRQQRARGARREKTTPRSSRRRARL